jgi:hypothetical protein
VIHGPHVEVRPDGTERVLIHSREIDALIPEGGGTGELPEQLHRLAADVAPASRSGPSSANFSPAKSSTAPGTRASRPSAPIDSGVLSRRRTGLGGRWDN